MKRAVLLSILMLSSILSLSQIPESFNYQVVVRDGSTNDPLVNQNVSFRMSILKGSSSGESQYSELHTANTGTLGIVNLVIGNGTDKTGNITTIDWGADSYFLKVEIDPAGGSTYVLMGTTQLLSVPYALYAKTTETYTETQTIADAAALDNSVNDQLKNLTNPTDAQDAVTKAYVDVLEQDIAYLIDLLNDYGITASVADIDGNEYRTVKIGTMIWMLENLRTTKFNDNTTIPYVTDNGEWNNLMTPAYCWYDNNNATYGTTYGALYNWYAVQTGNLCPMGWHVPAKTEWEGLIGILGGEIYAGINLKESGTDHWYNPNYADNSSGFTALPGGHRKLDGVFDYLGYRGFWWSSSLFNGTNGYVMYLINDSEYGSIGNYNYKGGFSIRCIKD